MEVEEEEEECHRIGRWRWRRVRTSVMEKMDRISQKVDEGGGGGGRVS